MVTTIANYVRAKSNDGILNHIAAAKLLPDDDHSELLTADTRYLIDAMCCAHILHNLDLSSVVKPDFKLTILPSLDKYLTAEAESAVGHASRVWASYYPDNTWKPPMAMKAVKVLTASYLRWIIEAQVATIRSEPGPHLLLLETAKRNIAHITDVSRGAFQWDCSEDTAILRYVPPDAALTYPRMAKAVVDYLKSNHIRLAPYDDIQAKSPALMAAMQAIGQEHIDSRFNATVNYLNNNNNISEISVTGVMSLNMLCTWWEDFCRDNGMSTERVISVEIKPYI